MSHICHCTFKNLFLTWKYFSEASTKTFLKFWHQDILLWKQLCHSKRFMVWLHHPLNTRKITQLFATTIVINGGGLWKFHLLFMQSFGITANSLIKGKKKAFSWFWGCPAVIVSDIKCPLLTFQKRNKIQFSSIFESCWADVEHKLY